MGLEIDGVVKNFGEARAIDGVSLSVGAGEFFTLLGPSGCGKTTLLRIVAGIYPSGAGRVLLAGRDITRLPMHARNLGMVFQSYALFPHLSAFDNVAFGLRSRGVKRPEIAARVGEALALVKLESLAKRFPSEMSGGQQQRVALARALVVRPELLLLDEPLSNLDARLRDEMRFEIRDLQRRLGITTVLVTHDIDEAFAMSDRIALMRAGKIVQVGRAEEIYRRPADRFAARFVGPTNELLVTGIEEAGGRLRGRAGTLPVWLPENGRPTGGSEAGLIVRPEHVLVRTGDLTADNAFPGEVEDVVFLGGGSECRVRVGDLRLAATLGSREAAGLRPGDAVNVGWNANDAVALEPA